MGYHMSSFEQVKSRIDFLQDQKRDAERQSDVDYARELQADIDELEEKIASLERSRLSSKKVVSNTAPTVVPSSVRSKKPAVNPQDELRKMRSILGDGK